MAGPDFSPATVELLRRSYPSASFHLADITGQLSSELKNPFNVISIFDVLFHFVYDEAFLATLKNIARLLKPDGCLVISENFAHHEKQLGGNYHYSRSLNNIESMLQQANFRLEYRRPMLALMNALDDSLGKFALAWWRLVRFFLRQGERVAWLTGACRYPLEQILTSLKHKSPSTEIAICRLAGKDSKP